MVIAIIAILAAILFPVFMSARQAATKGACLNYLSELGKAQLLYRDAYNDRLPLHFAYLGTVAGTGCYGDYSTYYFLLKKYTSNKTGSFQCPATAPKRYKFEYGQYKLIETANSYPCWASGIWAIPGDEAAKAAYLKEHFGYSWLDEYKTTSYAAFFYPRNAGDAKSKWKCFIVSARYRRPSRVVYLFEATRDFCDWNGGLMYAPDDKPQGGYLAPRHGGADQAGLLFFDGHAEMRTKSYIKNNAYYLLAYDDPE